jgi:hypothetical protein
MKSHPAHLVYKAKLVWLAKWELREYLVSKAHEDKSDYLVPQAIQALTGHLVKEESQSEVNLVTTVKTDFQA